MRKKLCFCIITIVVLCAAFRLAASPGMTSAPRAVFGMTVHFLQEGVSMPFDVCAFNNLKFMENEQTILKVYTYKANLALIAIFLLCGLWLCVLDFLARISKKRRYLTSSVTSSPFGGHSPPVIFILF